MIRFASALAVALVASPLTAKPVPGGVEESSTIGTIRVEALTDHILRVRMAGTTGAMPEDASWAVPVDIRSKRASVTQRSDGFDTAAMSVSVDPATLRLTVRDQQGSIVVDDAPQSFARDGKTFTLHKTMPTGQRIMALGDKTGGLDRSGKSFVNWNTDSFGFEGSTDPIYKSIPFYIAWDGNGPAYGLFLDNSFRTSFDFGHRNDGTIAIGADDGPIDYYIVTGNNLRDIVRGYTQLTGKAPMPPRWALGYQQSRYSYMSSAEVRQLTDRFASENIPLDVVWLDIDYQDRNRPFTVNRKAFPDFEGLVGEFSAKGIRTVPIVDMHIAAAPDQDYAPYDRGMAGDHFLKRADGSTYVAPVWPGPSVFPDFTRAKTRDWFGGLYSDLAKAGVAGIWNDMNEPAIFETPTKTMPLDNIHRIDGDGFAPRTATHAEIHNIYGMQNSRATFDGLAKLRPNVRPWVMTRATYAGGQRYAVTWTGDNNATWDHLKLAIAQQINLGLSGFTWSGADVGGFTGGPSPNLLTRWMQYGAFSPIFRNHSATGTPRAEPWVDGPTHLAIRKAAIDDRYRLLPYFYAVAADSARTGDPWMRPIAYDYASDSLACDPSMSFTIGGRLLATGNSKPESTQPYAACLPKSVGWFDYRTGKPVDMTKPLQITPRIDQLPVFVRAGTILPQQPVTRNTATAPNGPLELHVYAGPNCSGELYDDDGISVRGASRRQLLTCTTATNGSVTVHFGKVDGAYRPWWKQVTIIVHDASGVRRKTIKAPTGKASVSLPAA